MREQETYTLFQGKFKEIYADLVVVLGYKPNQIVFEIEAAFTHVAVAKTNPALAEENFKKAFHHIQRATLDAAKMLWIEFKNRLAKYLYDENLLSFCCNASEADFVMTYERAEQLAMDARKIEIQNVGKDPNVSIDKYYEAALHFKKCLNFIDSQKERKFRRFHIWYNSRERIIAFILGFLASALCSYIFFYVPNPKTPTSSDLKKEVRQVQQTSSKKAQEKK